MRKTTLKITRTKIKRERTREIYYCVTLPKPGGGRKRRFFKFTKEGKQEAETFLESAKIQHLNLGTLSKTVFSLLGDRGASSYLYLIICLL